MTESADTAGATTTPSSRGRMALVVLALLLVAALVVLALVAREWKHERDLRAAGEDAEVAARSAVVAMTTYDYRPWTRTSPGSTTRAPTTSASITTRSARR